MWSNPWILINLTRLATPLSPIVYHDLCVSNLIDLTHSREKGTDSLQSLVVPYEILLIRSLKPTRSQRIYKYCWSHTKSRVYLVKSGYTFSINLEASKEMPHISEPCTTILKSKVWLIKTVRKIKHFMWHALSDCIPACNQLSDRHFSTDKNFPRCGADEETVNQMSFECPPSI